MLEHKSINNDDPKNLNLVVTFVSTALIFFSFFDTSSQRCSNYIGMKKKKEKVQKSSAFIPECDYGSNYLHFFQFSSPKFLFAYTFSGFVDRLFSLHFCSQ